MTTEVREGATEAYHAEDYQKTAVAFMVAVAADCQAGGVSTKPLEHETINAGDAMTEAMFCAIQSCMEEKRGAERQAQLKDLVEILDDMDKEKK